jgi:hypothetical protein
MICVKCGHAILSGERYRIGVIYDTTDPRTLTHVDCNNPTTDSVNVTGARMISPNFEWVLSKPKTMQDDS